MSGPTGVVPPPYRRPQPNNAFRETYCVPAVSKVASAQWGTTVLTVGGPTAVYLRHLVAAGVKCWRGGQGDPVKRLSASRPLAERVPEPRDYTNLRPGRLNRQSV